MNSIKKNQNKNETEIEKSTQDLIHFVENLKQQWVETIDALPDPFMIVGKDYKIKKANAAIAQAANRNIKTIIGETCYKVFAGRSAPCENCQISKVSQEAKVPAYEIHNTQNNRWYEVVSKPLLISGQDSSSRQADEIGILQIYRDRTETMQLQNQLAHKEKLASIGQLAGGFAHEINNPLGGILVFSQMLLREIDPKSNHYQDVKEIENAAQRCKTIVEGMLDFARQRPIRQTVESTDFHAAIESAVKFAQVGHNKNNNIDFELNLTAAKHISQSDRNRLIQIILNLCTNSIQAMPSGGILKVSTKNFEKSGQYFIAITVKDTGSGIKKEHLEKIFDPFFTTKEPGQGTGLGLSIVHGIVQDLMGSINVESKISQGTSFTLEFPIVGPIAKQGEC
jgi:two-component system, NtrC family, sensor kinase